MQILLWNDQQRDQIKTLLGKVKTLSPMPFGIQLAHAGRKASTEKPWLGKVKLQKISHMVGKQLLQVQVLFRFMMQRHML